MKQMERREKVRNIASLPAWERGLKLAPNEEKELAILSLPAWERG